MLFSGECGKFISFKLKRTVMNLQPPMLSMPITTKVVSLNPAQARCTRYNIM